MKGNMKGVTLITGSTGFVGRNFVRTMSKLEPEVHLRLLVRESSLEKAKKLFSDLNSDIDFVTGDLLDLSSLKKALEGGVDRVVHIAAAADDDIDMKTLVEVNVSGTENLLKAIDSTDKQIFFCHLSTSGVYGAKLPKEPVNEEFRKNPSSDYQESKWLTEQVVWRYFNNGLKGTILRSPSIIGPGDLKTFYRMVEATQKHKFPLVGGDNYLTFIDVEDLSRALVLSANRNNQENQNRVYNLYSFRVTLKELLDYLVTELNAEKPKKVSYRFAFTAAVLSELYTKITGKKTTLNRYRVRKFGSSRRYDMTRIKKELGYEPLYSFEDTMRRSFDWLYENGHLKK